MTYKVWVSGGGKPWLQFETSSRRLADGEASHWRKHGYSVEVAFTKELVA
jgi:hypothetical protein